ncbi:hypothetical protein KMZ32_05595 [Phycicoccus sp. MAQZ13P-2]|uniref:hypothetical protein n=1 Tax=Phycicoccus mangrovi TaxID=2840470 RepID=UPI001BFFDE5B|nr:hypothetical protein [Phycicoccus mangrovi]MBT9255419.1 hypothetical protein [Phycicoccus mangrovi]MBT9273551.1 hypothetical protein [Phycicoccus mangrovi]
MWWIIGLLVLVVVLGVVLERRRRGTGTRSEFTGDAPYGAEAAASRMTHNGPGLGGGGGQ